MTFYKHSKTL